MAAASRGVRGRARRIVRAAANAFSASRLMRTISSTVKTVLVTSTPDTIARGACVRVAICAAHKRGQAPPRARLCIGDGSAPSRIAAMSASMMYLLLRQIMQMLTQLARDGGAKDVELLVLRHQVAVLH